MMDIFLSMNNREQVIKLPIVPSEFKIKSPMNNEVFSTVNQGDLKMIGQRGLKSLVIDSFFPAKDYRFLRNRAYFGWEYVNIIESWIDRRLPVRLVVTNTPINISMSIEDFEYGIQDGSGDIYYSLKLEEFKIIKLKSKPVVNNTSKPKQSTKPSTSKSSTKKGDMKTNSIVEYLKSIGVDSSFANRKKLATEKGIKNYTGTAAQNTELLKKMRG